MSEKIFSKRANFFHVRLLNAVFPTSDVHEV